MRSALTCAFDAADGDAPTGILTGCEETKVTASTSMQFGGMTKAQVRRCGSGTKFDFEVQRRTLTSIHYYHAPVSLTPT